jgi:hypothetical protein
MYDFKSGDAWTNATLSTYIPINNMLFSTQDRDNDGAAVNCALDYQGGWWYNACSEGILTAPWGTGLKWNALVDLRYIDFMIKVK